MPKHDDDAPEMAVCDACGREMDADMIGEGDDRGMAYCPDCYKRRADDPVIAIQGRMLHLSELEMQAAEGDENLAAALEGDTVQSQIAAAKKKD